MIVDYQQAIRDTLDTVKDSKHPQETRHAFKNLIATLIVTEKDIKIALSGVNRKAPGSTAYVFAPPVRLERTT